MGVLRVGIVGKRGSSAIRGLRSVKGVEVAAFCDTNRQVVQDQMAEHGVDKGFATMDQMLDSVDAVVIGSPMQHHASQSIAALNAGKHVLCEVTAVVSMEECWQVLDAWKASGKTFMMAENYCYFEENILVREMARKGMFGSLYFGEGEYVHEVRFLHANDDGSPTWRYYWQVGVNGNTYITHELGPLMQWFKAVDPTERIESVICQGSGIHTDPEHPHDDTSLTLVKLASGKLLKIRLDMMSNTPGMSFYSLQGTLGTYESSRGGSVGSRIHLGGHRSVGWTDPKREWEDMAAYREHMPADWLPHIEAAADAGHGGSDYHTARLFAKAALEGSQPDIDIYDSLEWTAAGLCSQTSIASGGASIKVPDFRDPKQRPITLDCLGERR